MARNRLGDDPAAGHAGQVPHRTTDQLEAGLDDVRAAPIDVGTVELIVCRPAEGAREVLTEGRLDPEIGLVGDTWSERWSKRTPDGSPHPEMQLNLIGARFSRLISDDEAHRALAGDQLHLDLDLSEAHLPPGTRLALGSAVIEVTAEPHRGCAKFTRRFGLDAMRLVNSPAGTALRLRGVNAKVVTAGVVRPGDAVTRLVPEV